MTDSMISENFLSLITADMYIVIAAVYGICFALKRARFFDDRFIPLAAIILGAGLELLNFAYTGEMVAELVLRGIICGMAAVYVSNIVKQIGDDGK